MPDREIIKIPANRTLADLRRKKRKLQVAAYCRVSTEAVSYTHLDVYKRQSRSC